MLPPGMRHCMAASMNHLLYSLCMLTNKCRDMLHHMCRCFVQPVPQVLTVRPLLKRYAAL